MNHSLKDVVSIVAGLTQPLEIEIIRSLLKQEAIVIVPASNTDTILQIKSEVADIATGTLITLINDPLDYDRSRDITDHIEQNYGRIDLVIVLSNQVYSPHPLTQLDYTTWDTMQCDSLSYCFMAARLILPLMIRHQRGTFIQVGNSLPEGLHRSPLNRIASTLQEEVSKILHEEVSGHGVQYYHVFSNMENQKTDRTKEAAYILQLFKDSTSQDKQLFHQAYGNLDTSLLSGHHLN